MKFTSVWALFWLANEEARERIGVDAVRRVGPLRMIRREVNNTAPAAGSCTGCGHKRRGAEVVGNTVTNTTELLLALLFWYQAKQYDEKPYYFIFLFFLSLRYLALALHLICSYVSVYKVPRRQP